MSETPRSILIIGSGAFGLSTAWALARRTQFVATTITIVDDAGGHFPPLDAASVDSSRVIRSDYSDTHHTKLATAAQELWRKRGVDEIGGQGRYQESGILIMADEPKEITERMTGMDYAKASWRNAARIADESALETQDKLQVFERACDLQQFLGTEKPPGDWGYLNGLAGWVDAGEAMKWLYNQVQSTGRVRFVDAKVDELTTEADRVTGAKCNGENMTADLVIVAAGAWTGSLIDLRGRVEATAQALGYVELTQAENDALSKMPTVINLSRGVFIIPPRNCVLKVARHSFGYLNPETVSKALPPSPDSERQPIITSQPVTSRNGHTGTPGLPQDSEKELRGALKELTSIRDLANRPWKETRLCWYSDTRDGDWLVDWHPGWKGLFIATGDSGHAFKFLPVLGDNIVDCMHDRGGELGKKWKWRSIQGGEDGVIVDGKYRGLITQDGSRGGRPGLILKDELLVTTE